jgi:predicted CoA-binding protein
MIAGASLLNEPNTIQEILDRTQTIAVVGLADHEGRASYGVSRFMQSQGYRILPINPNIESSLGEPAFPDLDAAIAAHPGQIQLVNVFRRPEFVPEIVDAVIHHKIPYLWLQEGVIHPEAAAKAEAAGVKVVMDHCLFKERLAHGPRKQ